MRRYVQIVSTCAVFALAVSPVLAQGTGSSGGSTGTTGPSAPTQQRPGDSTGSQPGMTQPGTSQPGATQPGMGSTRPGAREDAAKGTQDRGSSMDKSTTQDRGTSHDMRGARGGMGKDMAGKQDHVRKVQEKLKSEGHDPGPIDGMMGPQTQQAIKSYQRQENLPETGRLDQQTLNKLGVDGRQTSQR